MELRDTSQPYDDGKVDASIINVFDHHAFALDAFGQEYFIYRNALGVTQQHGFDELRVGSTVRLRPIDNGRRGWMRRGIEVEIISR
jgi:hypothetical protein